MQGKCVHFKDRRDLRAGEYERMPFSWLLRPPHGPVGRLSAEMVVEHEDGTISSLGAIVTPFWRGRLLHGVWQGR